MKNSRRYSLFLSCVMACGLPVALTAQNTASQDMHQAGQDTKTAAKDTGSAVKKGSTKTYHATKKGATVVADKTKEGTTTGYDKTKEGATKGYDKTKEGVEHVFHPKGAKASEQEDAIKESHQKANDNERESTQKLIDSRKPQ